MCVSSVTKASHISYEDMTYKWISGNTYELTLTLYRDCGGAAAPATLDVSICSASTGASSPNCHLLPVSGTGLPIFPICSYPLSICAGGTDEGFQKYVYKGTFTLTSAKNDWTLTHGYCCREASLTNIVSPLITGTGIKCVIDNLNYPGNSSPTFNDEPVLFACCNQSFSYNQSATDVDGDSLFYSLYYPYNDNVTCTSGSNITYSGTFNYLNFITSSPTISMNPLTGYLTMYPTVCTEASVMGVKVEEYHLGNFVGSIMRDNMVIVTNETALGNKEIKDEDNISVYPNPANSIINVIAKGTKQILTIFNTLGDVVYTTNPKSEKTEIDISSFPKGMYLIQVQTESSSMMKKVIKD